jgi:hypothetical protein
MNMLGEMMMSIDVNGDWAVDGEECGLLDGEMESMICEAVVSHCDLNGDGKLEGCEFLACVHLHGEESGCIAECPCAAGNESEYCMFLNYCMENYELPEEPVELV